MEAEKEEALQEAMWRLDYIRRALVPFFNKPKEQIVDLRDQEPLC